VVATSAVGLAAIFGVCFAGTASATGNDGTLKGTPCSATARACVDLDKQRAWLAKGGVVTGGPFEIATGGLSRETPPGTFHVINKVQDFKSKDFPLSNGQPAPMPWSVFFEPGGIAFHGGDVDRASSGCVHLQTSVAETFFHTLNVGDEVQVVQSKDGIKNAFYKVHHQKPPSRTEQREWALGHTNALRREKGLPPLPAAAKDTDDADKTKAQDKAQDKAKDADKDQDKAKDEKASDSDTSSHHTSR
jgi:hypothetical protein